MAAIEALHSAGQEFCISSGGAQIECSNPSGPQDIVASINRTQDFPYSAMLDVFTGQITLTPKYAAPSQLCRSSLTLRVSNEDTRLDAALLSRWRRVSMRMAAPVIRAGNGRRSRGPRSLELNTLQATA